MSERPITILLQDINEACDNIEQFTVNMSYEAFEKHTMVKQAVERNIEIIGEACGKLPEDFKDRHRNVDWHKATGMRNRLIHGYFAVDLPMLWNTATHVIPEFNKQIQQILQDEQ